MRYILLTFFWIGLYGANAQTLHERTWFFGQGHSLQFNNGVAQPGGIPPPAIANLYNNRGNGTNLFQVAVSDTLGQLQFFVQIKGHITNPPRINYIQQAFKVFDALGRPMPGGIIAADAYYGATDHVGCPIVVPWPGKAAKYFLFYVLEGSLRYSLVDMALNGGYGAIVPAEKDLVLTGFSSLYGYKITSLVACDGLWLIAKSATDTRYYSFKIDAAGVRKEPIISDPAGVGVLVHRVVTGAPGGLLRGSHKGILLAAGTAAGIELYDIEPCSGRVLHARLIDTIPAYGLCFSPDDTKLYASYTKPSEWGMPFYQGEVYQYDLGRSDTAAIRASRTLVMRNPIYELIGPFGPVYFSGPMGDLKLGPNGKIYISKNNVIRDTNPCSVYYPGIDYNPVPLPATNNCLVGQYMHIIHQPNAVGMACSPELDAVKLNDLHLDPGPLLQNDIRIAPQFLPDTLKGNHHRLKICFATETLLNIPPGATCYQWDNGDTTERRQVSQPGSYWLQYRRGCNYYTDTYSLQFIPLPQVPASQYACPGQGLITIDQPEDSREAYTYTLSKLPGGPAYTATSSKGQKFTGLDSGAYSLRIQSGACDTILPLQLNTFPKPELNLRPRDTSLRYGDTLSLQAGGANRYTWWPGYNISSPDGDSVQVWPRKPTEYLVVGLNAYGCTDTASIRIAIDYQLPGLIPNAFSPDGDGLNDVFRVEGITFQQILYFRIYNRYGETIYSGAGNHSGWDGTFKGRGCDIGTYYYMVELQYPNGHRKVYKGDVLLIR